MVCYAVSGGASQFPGLQRKLQNSLSDLWIAQNVTFYCQDSEVEMLLKSVSYRF